MQEFGANAMRCVAIIPARGGSKRVPNKNIVECAGHPLLAWTVEAALDSWAIDAVFVSTDDERIAHVARQYGAEVIERPASLASDTSTTESALLHGLDWLETQCGLQPELITLLQCTSPLRPTEVINRAVEKAVSTGCDAVVGVHATIEYFFSGTIYEDHFITGYDPKNRPRTQDIHPLYKENGSIYVTRTEFLKTTGCRMGGDTRPVVMTPTEGIDIDSAADLERARYHLQTIAYQTGSHPSVRLV